MSLNYLTATGVIVSVFRSDLGDSTNGGVTSPENAKGKTFIVLDDAIVGGNYSFDDVDEDHVVLRLVRRKIGGREYIHAEPLAELGRHGMFGGNFVFTSDSRLRSVLDYPIPVHDRFE